MSNNIRTFVLAAVAIAMATACRNESPTVMAEELYQTATRQFEQKQYDSALATIDTLRSRYPTAIEVRWKAIELYQNIELRHAEEDLALVDTELQKAKADYNNMKRQADLHHAAGTATATELTNVTRMRMLRDSLQTQFDMQCAKIKYIHKRQEQLKEQK